MHGQRGALLRTRHIGDMARSGRDDDGDAAAPATALSPDADGPFSHHYTVTPTNFVTLPEAGRRRKIGAFLDLLRMVRGPLRIRLTRKFLTVPVGGADAPMPVLQLYLSSTEPLNGMLEALRYEHTSDLGGHAQMRIIREGWRDMVVDPGDGSRAVARCLTLAHVPYELPWAWVATGVFPACHEVAVWIDPVEHQAAMNHVRRRKSLVHEPARTSRAAAEEYERLERAEQSMRQTHSGLFRCRVICTVLGADRRGLRAALRDFRNLTSVSGGGRFVAQIARQGAMLTRGWGRELTFDLGSMSCLYSMVSADVLEVPNGLVLGINTDTGAPVIFDFARRTNYNVAVIGTSGSGKSFTAKMMLRRLLDRHPDSLCFVIDPMGEYHDIAPSLGLDRIQIAGGGGGNGGGQLGLDPFKLLSPADAADILGRVTRAPEDVVKQFRRFSDKVDSIDGLYGMLGDDPASRRWLDDLVDGPLAPMMRGRPRLSDRTVISLKRVDGKPHEAMLLVLALNRVWRRIEEMPPNVQKIVLLDEAWMLFKMEGPPSTWSRSSGWAASATSGFCSCRKTWTT